MTNRRKTNLMTYVLGPHKKMGITTSQATEASMSFWAKKKGLGIWDFEGEKDHVQKDGNVWETNVYPAMQRRLWANGPCLAPLAHDTWPHSLQLSLMITLVLDDTLCLESFRQWGKRLKLFLSPLAFSCLLAQNNPYTKMTLSGEARSEPL